jgi:hypothetical protein
MATTNWTLDMANGLIIALLTFFLVIPGPAWGEDLSIRVCQAMKAAVPNWTRTQEHCVQEFDSNFLEAKVLAPVCIAT